MGAAADRGVEPTRFHHWSEDQIRRRMGELLAGAEREGREDLDPDELAEWEALDRAWDRIVQSDRAHQAFG